MNVRLSAEQRKEEIVLASMPLFALKGFRGTTTKDLASAAGISEALLYKHFPSKEALYDKIKDYCCGSSENVSKQLALLPPSTETLMLVLYCIVFLISEGLDGKENGDLTKKLMMNSLSSDGVFADKFLQAKFHPYIDKMKENFEAAKSNNDFYNENISFQNLIWFSHHFIIGTAIMNLPEMKIISYENKNRSFIDNLALFIYNGIGLKKEVVDKNFNSKQYKEFLNF